MRFRRMLQDNFFLYSFKTKYLPLSHMQPYDNYEPYGDFVYYFEHKGDTVYIIKIKPKKWTRGQRAGWLAFNEKKASYASTKVTAAQLFIQS
jgi:hypothetical protein